jgi:hypothetical protein
MTSLGFIKKFRLFHMLCIAHVQYMEAIGQTEVQIKDNPFVLEKSVLSGKAKLGNIAS